MKYFIITVDTEGDNLWEWTPDASITTNNISYLGRFQDLCNKFGFKPVYLSNYEMLSAKAFVAFAKQHLMANDCEIGLHLHAWNTPPYYDIEQKYNQPSYLIEYPTDIMKRKFEVLYDLYLNAFGAEPFSHRSGRWAMDERYFSILKEKGVKIDCSVTPHVNWSKNKGAKAGGSDYRHYNETPSFINGVFEVPMTIKRIHWTNCGSWKHRLKTMIFGSTIWLRPAITSEGEMMRLLNHEIKGETEYVEFMIHSSELMPGGSPYYKDELSIEKLYSVMERVFSKAVQLGYKGITLKDFYELHK